jgi:hypothetical protein
VNPETYKLLLHLLDTYSNTATNPPHPADVGHDAEPDQSTSHLYNLALLLPIHFLVISTGCFLRSFITQTFSNLTAGEYENYGLKRHTVYV